MKPAAAIYLRVSKDDGSQTTDNQRPDVEQMAAGRGYEVAPDHVYVDEASGAGGRAERPALDRLFIDAARGKFAAVFVWALDRFSRDDDFVGGLLLIGEIERYGVHLLSHQETWIDTAGPFRDVWVHLSLKLAARERAKLIDRTKAGLERARDQLKNGPYWNEKKKKTIVSIGRQWVPISDAMRDRALALRAGDRPGSDPPAPWRYVRQRLVQEGYANVPNYATLARRCTQTGGVPAEPGPRRTRGSG